MRDLIQRGHQFLHGRVQALWTPAELGASLALWLDAEDTASITLNGSTVSQWDDKSGNGNHVVQATAANQPTYNTTTLNGKPALVFDGVNDFIFNAATILNNSDSIMFLMVRYKNAAKLQQSVWATDVTATDPRIYLQANAGTIRAYGGNYLSGGTYTVNTTEVNSVARLSAGNTIEIYRNGNLAVSGVAGVAAINSGIIFGRLGGGTFGTYASIDISEAIGINAVLTTTDRQKLEGYLAWKWGLEANLPADHPYKSAPPLI